MTDLPALQKLAAWLSPAFPVSGFAYSHGLEQAVAEGWITDADSARDWIHDILTQGSGRNDAILLAHAYRGEDVADLTRALAGYAERRRETNEQGAAFARVISATEGPLTAAPYPVALGQASARTSAPLDATLTLFLQAFATTLIQAAVKLVPLGQTEGQRLLTTLQPALRATAQEAATASLDDLGSATLRADLAALRHETLQPRIFRT